jgi:CHAD domain-containing protein
MFGIADTRKSLDRLASQSTRTLRSPGIAEVHDLRVAIRRFTQVLLVFKPCFPAKEVKRVHRALKKTMAVAGQVRDLDIAIGFLAKSRREEAAILLTEFRSQRKEAGRSLADKLQRWTKRRMSSKWRRKLLVASPGQGVAEIGTVEEAAKKTLPRLVKRFLDLGDQAGGAGDLEQLHRLRIAAKRLRYTLELLAPSGKSALGARLKQIKNVQAILGSINDAELVRKMVVRENAARSLCAELVKRRDQKIEEFRSHWKADFAGPGNLVGWRENPVGSPGKRGAPRKPPARSDSAAKPARDSSSAAR